MSEIEEDPVCPCWFVLSELLQKFQASVWRMLAEAAIEAALIETYPRSLAELAFGFAT